MCMGIGNCLILVWGLGVHLGMWAVLLDRPHGVAAGLVVEAATLGLVLLRLTVRAVVPRRVEWFHDTWTWSGLGDELREAILLGPVYVLLTVLAVAVVAVRAIGRIVRRPRGATSDA